MVCALYYLLLAKAVAEIRVYHYFSFFHSYYLYRQVLRHCNGYELSAQIMQQLQHYWLQVCCYILCAEFFLQCVLC